MIGRRNNIIGILCVLGFAAGTMVSCQHAGGSRNPLSNATLYSDAPGFTISVPPNVAVKKEIPVDFVIYRFTEKGSGEQTLFMYGGYYPNFPLDLPAGAKERKTKINGMKAESIMWKSPSGLYSRQTLIQLYSGPKDLSMRDRTTLYLHCAYTDRPENQARTADAMIASIRIGDVRATRP